MEPAPGAALRAEVADLLAALDRAWAGLDLDGLSALWDRDEPAPSYIGDEWRVPVVGWPDLTRHWGRVGGRLREARTRSTLVEARSLAPDLALAIFLSEWELTAVEAPDRHRGQCWVTAVLRRRPAGWRFVHHAESPANVDPGELG
jgi:hypothetical protein